MFVYVDVCTCSIGEAQRKSATKTCRVDVYNYLAKSAAKLHRITCSNIVEYIDSEAWFYIVEYIVVKALFYLVKAWCYLVKALLYLVEICFTK